MQRIIKSHQPRQDIVSLFERDMLEVIESNYVDDNGAIDQAAVLAEARAEAEQAVRDAYAEGMRRGMDKGLRQFKDSVAESAEMLRQSSENLEEARSQFLDSITPYLVELASSIAGRVVRRELTMTPEIILTLARQALERLTQEESVTLRVNPQDLEALKQQKVTLLEEFDGIDSLDIVADETIEAGGCTAESKRLFIDARLESQLAQILDQLME